MSGTHTFTLSVAQLNVNRSIAHQQTLFTQAIEQSIDLLLIQEPYLMPNTHEPLNHRGFTTLRVNLHKDTRVVAYVLDKQLSLQVTPRLDLIDSPYVLPLEVFPPNGTSYLIYNIYNRALTARHAIQNLTFPPRDPTKLTVMTGDFNAHSPYWEPRHVRTSPNAVMLEQWIDAGAILWNSPNQYTFHRKTDRGDIYRSIIDLTFAFPPNTAIWSNRITNWTIDDECRSLSDHETIRFHISSDTTGPPQPLPPIQRWRWDFWKSLPPPPPGEFDDRSPWPQWDLDFFNATKDLKMNVPYNPDHQ
jgi:hypothetical protein